MLDIIDQCDQDRGITTGIDRAMRHAGRASASGGQQHDGAGSVAAASSTGNAANAAAMATTTANKVRSSF